MSDKQILKFELSQKDIQIKRILDKEFLELDIMAISDIYPNRNKSAFTKDSLENSKETCFNKPILGCFDTISNDFREHNGEDKYDKEFQRTYWDTSGIDSEKILGLIRESDSVEVVETNGQNWLKISCAIWSYYSYKQVKKLLKSATKKVSVEILVNESHFDDNGIQVIDRFTLTGITILGDKILEGIPGAHLSVVDLIRQKDFSNQVKCLSFAYNQKDGTDKDIKLDYSDYNIIKSNQTEGTTMTYKEKLSFLTCKLTEAIGNADFYVCDFSEEFVIVYHYNDDKYYKISYAITANDEEETISFNIEDKVEQMPTFKDMPKVFITIGEEDKNIDEIFAMYSESVTAMKEVEEKYSTLEQEFADYKEDVAARVYTVSIDDVEFNVEQLKEKFDADAATYAENLEEIRSQLAAKEEEYNNISETLCNLQAQMKAAEEEKLCGDGIALADEEDELDEDDRCAIKEKCTKHEYSSLSEVEDDIARALYQKKKNNRSKNFKSNAARSNSSVKDEPKSIFDKLQ